MCEGPKIFSCKLTHSSYPSSAEQCVQMRIGDELVGIDDIKISDSSCILQDVRKNVAGEHLSRVRLFLQRYAPK